ncbi:MAG: PAS domain S-box protein [Myxococcales bacterium]|nr:PAS domain S-box protein [Myxococcales bacterium]
MEQLRAAPMLHGLTTALGVAPELVTCPAPEAALAGARRRYDVFLVREAKGSPWVPAQADFVVRCGVRSVLGFGGLLPSGSLFAMLLFLRTSVTRETAELFQMLALDLQLALLPFDRRCSSHDGASRLAEVPHVASSPAIVPDLRQDARPDTWARDRVRDEEHAASLADVTAGAFEELLREYEETALRNSVALEQRALDLGRARDDLEIKVADLTAARELVLSAERAAQARALELSRAHVTLRTLCDFLLDVHQTMPCALIVHRVGGDIVAVNDAASELLGYGQEELIGRDIGTVFAGGPPPSQEADGAGVIRRESVLKDRAGTRIPVLYSAKLLSASPGDGERRIVSIALDLRERKRLELELRQAQKLESVGRLAAGIAHEINTPVQFVNDSVHFIRDAMDDLARLVSGYRRLCADGNMMAEVRSRCAEELERTADLAYLLEHVPPAIERSIEGLGRVATIVRSMKEFAHPDLKEMVPVDLNRAIESTLAIARNEYKYVADVETDLGELPPILCFAGELNQAILNIVVNAAHAIGEVVGSSGERGRIGVRTRCHGATVSIAISDTGTGIPPEARERIFEPFFTTKEVGKGTGQGLAMARSVVQERHRGTLTFDTELGRGTTFTIRIPVARETCAPRDTIQPWDFQGGAP